MFASREGKNRPPRRHQHTREIAPRAQVRPDPLARTPPAASGYSELITNGGELRNSGIEMTLGVAAVQQRDFLWTIHSTFARTRSLVQQLPGTGFSPPTAGIRY